MMQRPGPGDRSATVPGETAITSAATAPLLYDEYQALARRQAPGATPLAAYVAQLPPCGDRAAQLQQLDTFKGWLDSFCPFPPAVVAELKQLYTVRLTYHSNAIEGNSLTQSETEMVLSHGVTVGGKTLVEHLEVIGHRDAMEYMEELAGQATPLGEWEIKSLNRLIVQAVDQVTGQQEAGKYRSLDVRAAGTEHVYPPHFRVPELMTEFTQWLGSTDAQVLHPVEYAAQAHYRFVSIHPFRDGNGRTARLLMNLLLLRAGYPITVITNAERAIYIEALVYGQSHADDVSRLTELVAAATRVALIDYLELLATAGESRGRGLPFYRDMLAFIVSTATLQEHHP